MRKQVDWEAVEIRYRTGTESLRSVAADFGITEGAIRQRAKKEGWARDLGAKVKQATEALLLRKAATHDVRTEREAVAVEAEMRSEVILRHRKDVAKVRRLVSGMLDELENPEDGKKEPIAKRAALTKQLTETMRLQVSLERQAFGISVDDGGEDPDPLASLVREIMGKRTSLPIVADDPAHRKDA